MNYNANLKLVLQLICVFQHYGRSVSEDVCDLLDGEQALLSEEHHHAFYRLHGHGEDLGEVGHHPLKTA